MPYRDGSLTPKEKTFVAVYAETQDRVKAEQEAGLAPRSGYQVLARPDIQAEIARAIAAEMHDLSTIAANRLRYLLTADKVPAQVLFNAVKYTLDRVLGETGAPSTKELHEMTPEEIGQAIATLETQAAAMAKPVNSPDPGAIFD